MAAGVEDEPPFSPSDFLNLSPATPCLNSDGPAAAGPAAAAAAVPDGDGPAAAAAAVQDDDDLVLPFITRVLMEDQEEGINPDHSAAALLEAQQPFADILSLSAVGNTEAPPPFSDDAPEPAAAFVANDATWPYDPVELAHQLLLGQQQQQQQHHRASSSADNNNSMVITMEMLNQAFLKGMQEANKFLPMPMPTTSNTRLLTHLSDGRGRKNKHSSNWDGFEAETGRSCKLMVPETEEASVKDEESIQNGYQSLAEQMMSLNITISDVDTKAETEKKKNTRKGRSTTNDDEAVDLRSLLIHCAQDIATGDRLHATQLLGEIKQRSSPTGDATQRLAHCFSKGLEARLAGTGSQVYKSLLSRRIPALELHKAYRLYLTVCCFQSAAFIFSDLNIRKAVAGRKKLHIVEYGEHYGIQWPILLRCMTTWKDGPPEVKITSIVLPQPGFCPSARIEQTKRRLGNFAHHCGVPFKFHSIVAKWETVCAHDLDIEPDEVLIVNGLFHLGKLMDEGGDDIDSPSPRDIVLGNISKMRPDMLILCTENSSYNTPFFVTRFQEVLFHYSAMFDMMDATSPRDSGERILVEQELFGQCALNAIAREGSDRVERPESYRQWQVRNIRAGLRQLPLDPDIAKAVSKKVKDVYHKDFVIDVDQQWLLQGWKGRILYAMSTWVASKS